MLSAGWDSCRVFDLVTIRVADRAASARFYELVLASISIEKTHSSASVAEWGDFSIAQGDAERPATRRLHVGFGAPSRAHADEFWRVGTEAGYRDDGAPGPRPQYTPDYYGAFLLDPDGNSVEAVHHGSVRPVGNVDHLWIRVADVAAARRFYETIAPHAGFRLGSDARDRAQFRAESGSFSLISGTPTENLHMAFAARDDVSAGAPVLDPGGNSVELVKRNREER